MLLISGAQYQQITAARQKQDEKFLKWLSPSYWLVDAQLHSVRQQRGADTLQWARDMPEFRVWQRSDVRIDSKDRILWIKGTLGIGKSTMAGYFIDLLKCLYPKSIIAYFFCKSGQPGLTKAIDIIRSLAYQCIESNEEARSVLEALQLKDFQIDQNLSVSYLFEKLVREPLIQVTSDVYIVIDGLDEADWITQDMGERRSRSEIDVLLNCLAGLPKVRILFISRSTSDIASFISNSVTKPLRQTDNMDDIDKYVKQTIDASERLKTHFANEKIDPYYYFHSKANGIFLWVVVVLHQLGHTKSRSMFCKYLNGFSDASGDMERLYTSVLSRVEGEDKMWTKEILKWVVVAQGGLSVAILKEAVELSLNDKLPDFQSFLEVECGALVHLVPRHQDIQDVQLIHETLRSFLMNRDCCSAEFMSMKDSRAVMYSENALTFYPILLSLKNC